MRTLDDLRNLMKERGLEKLIPYAERLSAPSIRLLLTEVESEFYPCYPHDPTPIGCSKINGLPDLPVDFIWPEVNGVALPFLAQLRFEDIRPHDTQEVLPSSGMLFFFFDMDAHFIDNDALDACSTFYFNGDSSSLQRRLFPENIRRYDLIKRPDSPINFDMPFETPSTIRFQTELSVADDDCVEFYELAEELTLTERERSELWWQLSLDWSDFNAKAAYRETLNIKLDTMEHPYHQLLGFPYCGNYDGRNEITGVEKETSEPHDWRLLFQLSDNERLNFGNRTAISFFIHNEALKKYDFSDVRVTSDG